MSYPSPPPSPVPFEERSNDERLLAYFGTIPSQTLAIICLSLFAAIGCVNLLQTCRMRAWFMLLVPFTAFAEAGGYLSRLLMIHNAQFNTYVAMQCLLIIPPVFLAAVDYWALKLLMAMGCPPNLDTWIKPKRLAVIMVSTDVITLAIQAVGAAILSYAVNNYDQHQEDIGQVVMLVGLGIQLVFFGGFAIVSVYVWRTPRFGLRGVRYFNPSWFALFSTLALMAIRNVYRVVEFADGGFTSEIASHETLFYIFDSLMIFLTIVIMTVFHYGYYLGPQCADKFAAATGGSKQFVQLGEGGSSGEVKGSLEGV